MNANDRIVALSAASMIVCDCFWLAEPEGRHVLTAVLFRLMELHKKVVIESSSYVLLRSTDCRLAG